MRPQAVSGMRPTACGSEELATASGPEQTSDSHTVLGTGLATVGRPSADLTLPPRAAADQPACRAR